MSIQSNKRDFEDALATMAGAVEGLRGVLTSEVLEPMDAVMREYTEYYIDDIDSIIEERNVVCRERKDDLLDEIKMGGT